jgi:DNA-directed RNA polymerase specialized sigma24 family protein
VSEWDRLERLSRIAARKWAAHSDHADLLQECRIVAWRNAAAPDAHIVRLCSLRCIDCLRSWHGDRRRPVPVLVPLGDHDAAVTDDLPVSASWGLADARLAHIADGLSVGQRPSDIAATLGVHPSRVSQHIAELRELVV